MAVGAQYRQARTKQPASLTARLGRGLFAKAAVLPITAASTLALTSVIIGTTDAKTYGLVMLIGSIFMVIPFADLGLGASIVNAVAVRHESRRAARDASALIRRAVRALTISGVAIVLVSSALSVTGLWQNILNLRLLGYQPWIPTLALFPFAVSLPLGIGQRVLVGLGKNGLVTLLGGIGPVSSVAVAIGLASLRTDPFLFAVAPSVGVLASSLITFELARRRLRISWSGVFHKESRQVRLWGSAAPMMVISIAVPLGIQLQRYFVAYLAPGDLPAYSIAVQLYMPCYSIISTAAVGLWPIFAAARANSWPIWVRSMVVMFAIGVAAFIGYFLFAPMLSSFISHGLVKLPISAVVAFSMLLLIMALHQPSAMLLTTEKELWLQALCAVTMLVAAIAISFVVTAAFGASGPVLGSAGGIFIFQLLACAGYVIMTRERRRG